LQPKDIGSSARTRTTDPLV